MVRFRYKWARKEQMRTVGTYLDTSLADARKERQDLANDIHPTDARVQREPARMYVRSGGSTLDEEVGEESEAGQMVSQDAREGNVGLGDLRVP
jgi:hypothetical protein